MNDSFVARFRNQTSRLLSAILKHLKVPISWFWSLHISKVWGILRHFAIYFVIEKFHLDGFISS
jgi:hypothetical protein